MAAPQMIKLSITISLVAIALASPTKNSTSEWVKFKNDFNKRYSTPEEEYRRMEIFYYNLNLINEQNEKYAKGQSSHEAGMNKFADQTIDDLTGCLLDMDSTSSEFGENFPSDDKYNLPKEVDWRKQGAVTPVKDQKHCGSCYSFSSTGALEGAHFVKTKKLVSLSEQNLMDCVYPGKGCEGGLMTKCFDYVIRNKGIDTEESYPYEAKDRDQCKYNESSKGATISKVYKITNGNVQDLMTALSKNGPVSVGIHASATFQTYKQGIYDGSDCEDKSPNHGVLLVGYGSENGKDYWIVKNSWGASWGNKGYIHMLRKNICHIADMAAVPV